MGYQLTEEQLQNVKMLLIDKRIQLNTIYIKRVLLLVQIAIVMLFATVLLLLILILQ